MISVGHVCFVFLKKILTISDCVIFSISGNSKRSWTKLKVSSIVSSSYFLNKPSYFFKQKKIIIPSKAEGDKVNLEVDVLGKYVERSLSSVLDRLSALEAWKKVGTEFTQEASIAILGFFTEG